MMELAFEQNSYPKAKNKHDSKILHTPLEKTGPRSITGLFSFLTQKIPYAKRELFYFWWSCRIPPPGPKNLQTYILRA